MEETKTVTKETLKVCDEKIKNYFQMIEYEDIYQTWLFKNTLLSKGKMFFKKNGIDTFWKLENAYKDVIAKKSIHTAGRRELILKVYNDITAEL